MTNLQTLPYRFAGALTVLALALAFMPALASAQDDDTSDYVRVNNTAEVSTTVVSVSSTGGNQANGSHAGNGGDGGSIGGDDEVENSNTGNGGNGGNAGAGGEVTTGEATSDVVVGNFVNGTDIEIDRSGEEEGDDDQSTAVEIDNAGVVQTAVVAAVSTGDNQANGSVAGEGGNGGSINEGEGEGDDGDGVEGSTTGDGGAGGTAGDGGVVTTGASTSSVGIISVINSVITRIVR